MKRETQTGRGEPLQALSCAHGFLLSGITLTSRWGSKLKGELLGGEARALVGLPEAEHSGVHAVARGWEVVPRPGLHLPTLLLLSLVSSQVSSSLSDPLSHSPLGFHPNLWLLIPLLLPLWVLLTPTVP